MTRAEAVRVLARLEVERLTEQERAEQLDYMLYENWRTHPHWKDIGEGVRDELEEGKLLAPPSDPRYDPVLLMWRTAECYGVTNSYLRERLQTFGVDAGEIVGEPGVLEPCPCCGRRTLAQRSMYGICSVCWWEDDGQDTGTPTSSWADRMVS